MLTAVTPRMSIAKSSANRLEGGYTGEYQLNGQKLDVSGDSQHQSDYLSESRDNINFGPAVVSHLKAAAIRPGVAPATSRAVSLNTRYENAALPRSKQPEQLETIKSPDRVSLSGNARELAYGGRNAGSETVPASAGLVELAELPQLAQSDGPDLAGPGESGGPQGLRTAAADMGAVSEVPIEPAGTGFGNSMRAFFHNLRSRLWGQAVTAYSRTPIEVVRGQRLHIQV